MSLIASNQNNSNVKNMVQCENCKMFLDETEVLKVNGKTLCKKDECNK